MKQQWLRYLLIFIALLPVLILRDFTPDNELKYLSIADEAIRNGNIFAFYNHGTAYADKPPLYIWAIMLGKLIFGQHLMFFISLLSVIPAFITLSVMGRWCSRYITANETINAEMMLVTSVYFLAPVVVLRMDMLMTMFITLSLYSFYKMYEYNHSGNSALGGYYNVADRKYRKLRWLLPLYIFFALFTKGPIGILMPLLSITLFLLINGELRTIGKYLGWRCWTLIGSLCAIWFTCVYLDGGSEYLNNLLFHQTVNRAVDAFHHKEPFYFYGVSYWFSLAPWSLAAFVVIVLGYCNKFMNTTLLKFFATIVAGTLVMLSIFSSKLEIYMLPCIPFIIYGAAMLLPKVQKSLWVKMSLAIPAILFILVFAASFFITDIIEIPGIDRILSALWAPLQLFTAILGIGGAAALWFLKRGKTGCCINSIAISLLAMIFCASLSMSKLNTSIGGLEEGCAKAMEVAKEKNIGNYAYYRFKTADNLDVYLGKELKKLEGNDLENLSGTILFVKSKYISRDSLLNKAVQGKEQLVFGKYSIIPFE